MKVLWLLFTGVAVVVLVSFVCFAPPLDESEVYPGGTIMRDAAGKVLRVSLGPGDVDCRPYYTASREDWIVKALIASEDGRFYDHWGVDFLSVARACFQNITSMRRVSGASTITMQATRLIAPHPRSYICKYKQAFKSIRLDFTKDKLWIISQYLNRAPFGSNLIGIEAAANGYFGKRAKDLGIGEAALLAGMVQAPSRFRPDRNLNRALKRREYVLERMVALGMITLEQYEGARNVIPKIQRGPRPFSEPFFCDYVQRLLDRRKRGSRIYGDYTTTLDMDIQEQAKRVVQSGAGEGGYSVAAVVMRVDDGAIVALACSDDYFSRDAGQVNVALSPRPAGSTLKPFLTAMAMDRGIVTPEERLADVPRAYQWYNPANFDSTYRGSVTASDALVLSLNLPFLQLLERIGVTRFGTLLRSMGCSYINENDSTYGLGMAIGNVDVSLVELVGAYGSIARNGIWLEPTALRDVIEARRGNGGARIFSEGASWLISDILSGNERSVAAIGHFADVEVSRFAWKTGTSSAYRDAWTVAWNPEYVIGVWCGYKLGHIGNVSLVGAEAAAPLAWRIARFLYPADNGPWFKMPDTIVRRTICSVSGQPASPDCPDTEEGRAIEGISSNVMCMRHQRTRGGKVVKKGDALLAAFEGDSEKALKLDIASPENNSTYYLVPGIDRQRIVCKVVGNTESGKLWWFVNGVQAGESCGSDPFVWEPVLGSHHISCSTEDGVSASVKIRVATP